MSPKISTNKEDEIQESNPNQSEEAVFIYIKLVHTIN